MALPPPREVPTTPAINAPDINTFYDIAEKDEKGRGAFSRVVIGVHRATGQPRAVKIMEKAGLVGKKAEMVAHEKEILRRTRHPAIIHLHECVQTPDRVFMIMDLMQGDLFDYIVKHKKLNEKDSAMIMQQLLSAVDYLHSNSVIHRDIKPENILISDPTNIKLADFGLAKVVQEWDVKSTPCGTSFYIAPEIIRGIEANGAKPLCTTREEVKFVDLWSCGVVLFVMLAGRPPFTGQVKSSHERRQLLAKIDRGLLFPDAQWAHISEEAKDLVSRLLTQDTSYRINATKALHHPWFKILESEETKEAENLDDVMSPQHLAQEINQFQHEVVEDGDTEGDVTSYNVARKTAVDAAQKPKVAMAKFPGKAPMHK